MMRRVVTADRLPGLTTLLLVVSLGVTALLAAEAHAAARDHRAAVERALRGFAALAGGELARRAATDVGYGGYARLLPPLVRRAEAGETPSLPADAADARLERARGLVRRFLSVTRAGSVVASGDALPEAAAQAIGARLREAARAEPQPFVAVHAVVDGEARSYALAATPGAPGHAAVGFEVDAAALGAWIAAAAARSALLPPALGGGEVGNEALSLSVRDPAGRERFRSDAGPWPEVGAEVAFGSAYSGALAGWTAHVSVDPAAARRLVIGGAPRSRLPLLVSLLALSAGLVVAALAQLRRERELQRLRADFVANVSHELRTPLAQIRLYAETLRLERVRSDDERRRALEVIDREARRLGQLVDNVLRFSRAERGPLELMAEPLALAPLVREVVQEFAPLAGPGVGIALELDEAARARADAGALRQVLLNLLDNAVKYGPREQRLTVSLERAGSRVRLGVADEGPGVPPAERERVFERFFRLARETALARAGAGIGLAVVRDLATRHEGRAFVEPAEGGGARFVVELPSLEAPA